MSSFAPFQPSGSNWMVLTLSMPVWVAWGRLPTPCPVSPIGMTSTMSCTRLCQSTQPRLAPVAEIPAYLRFHFPALRRHEVRVAGILPVLAELWLVEEVVEADLPDTAAELEAEVPARGGPPAERHASFGPEELPRRQIAVDASEP